MSAIEALARTVRLGWRLEQGVGQALAALGAGLAGALSPPEQQALTLALYAAAGAELRPLFSWEIAWFAAHLPPAPARLLVAGAGAGAEVVALRAQGYTVAATEPVARLATQCARVGAAPIWPVDHESLGTLAGQRFDAVILGWGSLTHVLTPSGRQRTLEAAATLTAGPILASFWTAASVGAPPSGRAVGWGQRTGAVIGHLRGQNSPSGLRFFPWCGFGAVLDLAELDRLARHLGRRLRFQEVPYPHAVWLPGPR